MKNKILPLTLAMIGCLALPASAQILIPNGDFSAGGTGWAESSGGPSPVTFSYPSTGGAGGGGYGLIDAGAGSWAVLVSPPERGVDGGGWPVATVGVTPGISNTFTLDLKTFAGTANGGMKVEAWAGNSYLADSGDRKPLGAAYTDWTTFTFNWFVPLATEKMIFVPLWGASSAVGVDNVGVVPEPSTYALLAIGAAGLGTHLVRRRRR
jgi:hypothetical protein